MGSSSRGREGRPMGRPGTEGWAAVYRCSSSSSNSKGQPSAVRLPGLQGQARGVSSHVLVEPGWGWGNDNSTGWAGVCQCSTSGSKGHAGLFSRQCWVAQWDRPCTAALLSGLAVVTAACRWGYLQPVCKVQVGLCSLLVQAGRCGQHSCTVWLRPAMSPLCAVCVSLALLDCSMLAGWGPAACTV